MSTNDVPGANPSNRDELAMGCWAEHADGSMILVESTEGNRAIYSVFDMAKNPPIEYRDAMPIDSFKTIFTWDASGKKKTPNEKWTWHDKTPFPWDRIIKNGINDGARVPAAVHVLNAAERIVESRARHQDTAAERVADSLRLQGQELDRDNIDHRWDKVMNRFGNLMERFSDIIADATSRKARPKKRAGGRR